MINDAEPFSPTEEAVAAAVWEKGISSRQLAKLDRKAEALCSEATSFSASAQRGLPREAGGRKNLEPLSAAAGQKSGAGWLSGETRFLTVCCRLLPQGAADCVTFLPYNNNR